MAKKTIVGILCGGRSGEHEVSLLSAKSVISAIDREKYEAQIIGIGKDGRWNLMNEKSFLKNQDDPSKIGLSDNGEEIFISPTPNNSIFHTKDKAIHIDVIFPVLHGTYGEDGTLQGMLDMISIPYVGADYLGSAVAMDKDVAKRLLKQAGLPTPDFLVFNREDTQNIEDILDTIEKTITYPLFVKPANLGSSVGIEKVKDQTELKTALNEAWLYDIKVIVEKGLDAREIECSLLGNYEVLASELGEIIPNHDFYSYEAKYLDPNGANLVVGVEIDPKIKKNIQDLAIKAYKTLGCEGMARADFFVENGTNNIYINELNTIPGFTKISMYPKLWEKSGIEYSELIDKLINLAFERHEIRQRLKTDFKS